MQESVEQLREELERARARLGELERDRWDFAAILTHDMRGLLTGVVGAVDLLRELGATERDSTVAEFAAMVERNGDELLRMIANLLVELHGGRILVESTLGAGATFSVKLPAGPPDGAGGRADPSP